MTDFITTSFVNDYKTTVQFLLQQMGTRFRGAVTEDSYRGQQGKAVEQFGSATAQVRTSRNSDTPNISLQQDARWVFPLDLEWGTIIDDQDKLRMIIDPTSPTAQAAAYAMQRGIDDQIIGAFFANAYTGQFGTTVEAFDTTDYQVANTVGGTSSGMNVAKLQAAMKALIKANQGELREPAYCAISSEEHDALLKETQVANGDFGSPPVLVDGRVKRFMGFEFLLTERLLLDPTNTYRLCPAWVKSGMHLGIWEDITAKVAERSDKSFSTQVYTRMTVGATRLMQGKVIQIECTV
jgi:hypothetical protein